MKGRDGKQKALTLFEEGDPKYDMLFPLLPDHVAALGQGAAQDRP
jgi:hypothetical protein